MRRLIIVANVSKEHIRKFHIPFIVRMRKEGWRVDVACRMDAPIPECNNAYDLPCDRNPFHGRLGKSIKLLRIILKDNQYDAVICNTITGSIITRIAAKPLRKKGLKVLYVNHGLHFFTGAPISRWIMGYPIEKALAPLTDVMITINSSDYQMAKKHLKPGAIERIHGIGVNLERFRSCNVTDAEKDRLRSSFGIGAQDLVLTYVAEINDNKNQAMLLKAFHIICQAIPNAKLLLIGPEHDGGKLRLSALAHGLSEKVLFLGWRDDIPELLKISDIYVASSKSEGLGVNLIEAMACNLPVIASKNRGHEEVICHRINGFLVEAGDFKEMAAYILQLAGDSDLKKAITKQAQRDIAKFETDCVLDELRHILYSYTNGDNYEKGTISDP